MRIRHLPLSECSFENESAHTCNVSGKNYRNVVRHVSARRGSERGRRRRQASCRDRDSNGHQRIPRPSRISRRPRFDRRSRWSRLSGSRGGNRQREP